MCKNNCADLPIAPMNSRIAIRLAAFQSAHRNVRVWSAKAGIAAKMSSKRMLSVIRYKAKMPKAKPKSPTRLTTKALIAAALADGFL